MAATMVKTVIITTGVERVEVDILPVVVPDMANTAKSAVLEVMVKVVLEGSEGEVFQDMMEIKMMLKLWTMTRIVAVPKE